jgi:hypothetical protein
MEFAFSRPAEKTARKLMTPSNRKEFFYAQSESIDVYRALQAAAISQPRWTLNKTPFLALATIHNMRCVKAE